MKIERIITRQAHPVPKQAYKPKGPFPPEIFKDPEILTDYVPQSDGGGEEMPVGSTVQNNFQPLNWFKCNGCGAIIPEHQIPDHMACIVPHVESS